MLFLLLKRFQRKPAPDLIREPAPDLIRGGYRFAQRKRFKVNKAGAEARFRFGPDLV
jgi:hypothetical protein